jgi:dGTPase
LKQFNYRRIYGNPRIKQETGKIEALFTDLFERFSRDVIEQRRDSPIWSEYLEHMDDTYYREAETAVIVRDYLASMTDANFLRQCQELFFPQPLPLRFA